MQVNYCVCLSMQKEAFGKALSLKLKEAIYRCSTVSGKWSPSTAMIRFEFKNIGVGDKVIVKDGKIFKEIHLASARAYPNYLNEISLDTIHVYPR